jgi:membrane-associated phospholipid phosphatase
LEALFEWGVEFILALQAVGGPLGESFFLAITFMGEEEFYLIIAPILFWSVDAATGGRVGFAYLISVYINPILKDIFVEPRPYEFDPRASDHTWPGSGMPSGHAQSSVFVWGVLAAQVKRTWFWVFAMFMAFLIGVSRFYLGVHFPHQVLAGWIVGLILLLLFLWLDPRVEQAVARLSFAPQLLVTLGGPILLALIYPHDDTLRAAAVMAGFSTGIVITYRFISYSAKGLWWKRILRSVIGIVILLIFYLGLSEIFPGEEAGDTIYTTFRFLRYAILGLWIGLGAPWLFSVLHLLPEEEAELQPESEL